jgi:hypothetical protein
MSHKHDGRGSINAWRRLVYQWGIRRPSKGMHKPIRVALLGKMAVNASWISRRDSDRVALTANRVEMKPKMRPSRRRLHMLWQTWQDCSKQNANLHAWAPATVQPKLNIKGCTHLCANNRGLFARRSVPPSTYSEHERVPQEDTDPFMFIVRQRGHPSMCE